MRRWILLATVVLILPLLSLGVRAEETATGLLSPLENAPSFVRDALPEQLEDTEALSEQMGLSRLFSLFASGVTSAFSSERGSLLRLFGITLLFSVAGILSKGRTAQTVMNGAGAVALYSILEMTVLRVSSFFSDLGTLTGVVAPIYAAVFAAGGGTATASASGVGFTAFLSVLEVLGLGLLLPLLRAMLALSLISSVSALPIVGELTRQLRNFYLFLLSLVSTLLSASLAFQTSLASAADSVAVRTVKFALGNAIPLVGGSVSAALGTLSSSLSLVKSTAGTAAVAVLLSLVLPLLGELLVLRFALSLCEGLAASLGASSFGGLLSRFRGLYDLIVAALAIVSVLFLLLVGMLAAVSPAVPS